MLGSFWESQKALANIDVLKSPYFNYPCILETNASLMDYTAVLFQMIDGNAIITAYANKKIKPISGSYWSFKLQLPAMHWAITKKFQDYLTDNEFQVLIKIHCLYKEMISKKSTADKSKVANLSTYNVSVVYRSGNLYI